MADNASVVRSAVEAFNSGKGAGLNKVFGRDLARNAAESMKTLRGAFPDLQYSIDHIQEEGNSVTFTYTVKGTHTGPLDDLKATKRLAQWSGWGVATVENGQITSVHTKEDWTRAAIALGLGIPSMTGTWIGTSGTTTVTLVCTQNGNAVSGSATVSGISGTFPLNGTNNYPNVNLQGQVFGLNVTFAGAFNSPNTIPGTLTVQGFAPMQTVLNRRSTKAVRPTKPNPR